MIVIDLEGDKHSNDVNITKNNLHIVTLSTNVYIEVILTSNKFLFT